MSPPRSCSVCADGAPSREAGSPVPGLRPVVSVDTRETSGWLRSLLVSRFLHLERELNTSTCFLGSRFVATAGRSGPWELHVQLLSQCRLSSAGCVVAVRLSRGVLSESALPAWLMA